MPQQSVLVFSNEMILFIISLNIYLSKEQHNIDQWNALRILIMHMQKSTGLAYAMWKMDVNKNTTEKKTFDENLDDPSVYEFQMKIMIEWIMLWVEAKLSLLVAVLPSNLRQTEPTLWIVLVSWIHIWKNNATSFNNIDPNWLKPIKTENIRYGNELLNFAYTCIYCLHGNAVH